MTTLHTATLVPSQTWAAAQSPFTSPAVDVPTDARAAELVIQTTTFTQPAQTAAFFVDRSTDGGLSWENVGSASFQGGPVDRHGNPITPGIQFAPPSAWLGTAYKIRARMATAGPSFTGPAILNWWTEP